MMAVCQTLYLQRFQEKLALLVGDVKVLSFCNLMHLVRCCLVQMLEGFTWDADSGDRLEAPPYRLKLHRQRLHFSTGRSEAEIDALAWNSWRAGWALINFRAFKSIEPDRFAALRRWFEMGWDAVLWSGQSVDCCGSIRLNADCKWRVVSRGCSGVCTDRLNDVVPVVKGFYV